MKDIFGRIAMLGRPIRIEVEKHVAGQRQVTSYPTILEAEDEIMELVRARGSDFNVYSVYTLFGKEYRKQGIIHV